MATNQQDVNAELKIARQQLPVRANPAPLGLAGFGLTTVLLSLINAGMLPKVGGLTVVVPMAFAFGGLAQLITGVLEYVNGNTFGTVAFTAYGAFWWFFAGMIWTLGGGWLKDAPADPVMGVALGLWGLFTLGMWVSTFRSPKAVWLVFLLLWITFFLLAIGHFGHPGAGRLGGIVGVLTGFAALYTSFAEVTNGTYGREVVPVGKPMSS
jgi:hypothetical protein